MAVRLLRPKSYRKSPLLVERKAPSIHHSTRCTPDRSEMNGARVTGPPATTFGTSQENETLGPALSTV
jgi:hypothetical protein